MTTKTGEHSEYIPICMLRGPGPAVYTLKPLIGRGDHCVSKTQAPAYTMGSPYKGKYSDTPGPIYNYDAALTAHGKKLLPSFTLPGRAKHKAPEILPGPGAYEPVVPVFDKPKITMAGRTPGPPPRVAPPPNAYYYKTGIGTQAVWERRNPSAGLRRRTDVGSIYYDRVKSAVPGPGAYGDPDSRATRRSAGPITIKGRIAWKEYNTAKEAPAPGSYNPPAELPTRKSFYMGQKHSECVMPFINNGIV